jgi:hypothetical protein
MKNKLLQLGIGIILLFLCHAKTFGQVTGKAYLTGQTDHSGIKVKFIPYSPTAQLDSTFTIADGSYSMELKGGIYKVIFTKPGYPDLYYKDNSQTLIMTNDVLQTVNLFGKNTVVVKGNTSGNWEKKYIYIVEGEVSIPTGSSLSIEPGTNVIFNSSSGITVDGRLIAIGSIEDSIYFTSSKPQPKPGDWKGIYLSPISDGNSVLKYCKVEFADSAVRNYSQNLIVERTKISNFFREGLFSYGATSTFLNNTICDFVKSGEMKAVQGTAISIWDSSLVRCNHIFNGYGIGIIANGNGLIENNIIHDLHIPDDGFGSEFTNTAIVNGYFSPRIINNYIYNCEGGIQSSDPGVDNSRHTLVSNNTITNVSRLGIVVEGMVGSVENNIIVNNRIGIGSKGTTQIKNNLLWNTFNFYEDENFLGKIVSINVNGDSVDSYFNIIADPQFEDGVPPHLSENSPAWQGGVNGTDIGINPQQFCGQIPSVDTLSLSGLVHQGNNLLKKGIVIAFTRRSIFSPFKFTKINNGAFKFNNIPMDDYLLYAVPDAAFINSFFPTFYVNKLYYEKADYVAVKASTFDVDIHLVKVPALAAGKGVIKGNVHYYTNYDNHSLYNRSWFEGYFDTTTVRNAVRNLPVLLLGSGGAPLAWTLTDFKGNFVFDSLPYAQYTLGFQRPGAALNMPASLTLSETAPLNEISLQWVNGILTATEDEIQNDGAELYTVYPNPVEDKLHVELKAYSSDELNISLLNHMGETVYANSITGTLHKGSFSIDTDHLASGMYLLKISSLSDGKSTRIFQVVKK